jgi:hypothetical protein
MSVSKVQFTRALPVIPSDKANVPSPYLIVSGLATDVGTNQLICADVDFIEVNVQPGDIVYDIPAQRAVTVVSVIDANTLEINDDVISTGELFRIYQASSQTGLGNQGCCLLSNGTADADVVTIGGDSVVLHLAEGIVCPVQVIKVNSSGTDLVALW